MNSQKPRSSGETIERPANNRQALWLLALLVVGIPILLTVVWLPSAKTPTPAYPSPNGYDDFVEATKLISTTRPDPGSTDIEELGVFLAANQSALEKVRNGLAKSCLSSNRYDSAGFTLLMPRISGFKHLAFAFRAEYTVALADGETNTATRSTIDCLHFGIESGRGGVMIESLVGQAIQEIAMEEFRNIVPVLDHTNAVFALTQLKTLELNVPKAHEILDKESSVRHQFGGMTAYFAYLVGVGRNDVRDGERKFASKCQATENHRKQLAAKLAKRLYELDFGKPATAWPDIVPQYLPAILSDAETGKALAFP